MDLDEGAPGRDVQLIPSPHAVGTTATARTPALASTLLDELVVRTDDEQREAWDNVVLGYD